MINETFAFRNQQTKKIRKCFSFPKVLQMHMTVMYKEDFYNVIYVI